MEECGIYVLPLKGENHSHIVQQEQAFTVLSYAMEQRYGVKICSENIAKKENGKPYFVMLDEFLKGGIEFNLSHCKNGIAVAISDCGVGIDIEGNRKVPNRVIEKCFSREEQTFLSQADETQEAFRSLWTLKESYVKMTGEGLTKKLSQITFSLPDDSKESDSIVSNQPGYFWQREMNGIMTVSVCLEERRTCKLEVLQWF